MVWIRVWIVPQHQGDFSFQTEAYPGMTSAKQEQSNH